MNIFWESSIQKYLKPTNKQIICLYAVIALGGVILSLSLGSSTVSIGELFGTLTGNASEKAQNIIKLIRLPRTIACVLAGSALAVSGLLLQTTLNNALASPGIIGINAGSGFFVVLSAVFFPSVFSVRAFAAFIGALLTTLIVYAIAKKAGASRMSILLSGIAIGSLMSAGIDAVITFSPGAVSDKTAFFIGGFHGITMDTNLFALPFIVSGLAIATLTSAKLNILLLGDEVAASLGLRVGLYRLLLIVTAAALAAGAVSIAGLIGFVGLIAPHIARLMGGQDHRVLVPLTILLGISLTLYCDILSRILFAPFELPVGIMLSFLGAPFFLFLLFSKKRRAL